MQSQLICAGCQNILLYPREAVNVCCAVCNTINSVLPPGAEMAQLTCLVCHTLLMYTYGAGSVRCSCCNTVNIAREVNQVAHVNCGGCHTTLMYPYGASSVKCSVCQYITVIRMTNIMMPILQYSLRGSSASALSHTSSSHQPPNQTVLVENPMSIDEHGKLVSNIVVGVATERKLQSSFRDPI